MRIKDKNGNVVLNSNLLDLVKNAITPGKVLFGEEDFIELLDRINIDTKYILNKNLKAKLEEYKKFNKSNYNTKPKETEEIKNKPVTTTKKVEENKSSRRKRKRDSEDVEEPVKKRFPNWDIFLPE